MPTTYRYILSRELWNLLTASTGRRLLFCLLNPSTATAARDDPTSRRIRHFGRREGGTLARLINLYAAISTDPKALRWLADPVGPDNDAVIVREAAAADLVIAGWGRLARKTDRTRAAHVLELLRRYGDVHRLGPPTDDGQPRHPLYLPNEGPGSALQLHARALPRTA